MSWATSTRPDQRSAPSAISITTGTTVVSQVNASCANGSAPLSFSVPSGSFNLGKVQVISM
ncbi:hypothetical protein CQY23_03235 [Mycobacterium celatum]|uniref:Uncharacterized protein n=1 Tax=Mycobacterium celatum TaxID=28045 RepID=A0A2G5PQH7_MYCCE|nr:hypothetical protein CQY23_03235 [Mycobacterium celatum]